MNEMQTDPLLLYESYKAAIKRWTLDNSGRFVIPANEHWPDGVEKRREATEHYSSRYADEILDLWAEEYVRLTEEYYE